LGLHLHRTPKFDPRNHPEAGSDRYVNGHCFVGRGSLTLGDGLFDGRVAKGWITAAGAVVTHGTRRVDDGLCAGVHATLVSGLH